MVKLKSLLEGNIGITTKKGKTIELTHRKSGKEIVVVNNPSVLKKYAKMGYLISMPEGKIGNNVLTEGKISSDVERAAKKLGIKFDKKTKVVTTNKYSNPSGDMKRFGKDHEKVKMNQWMDDNPKDMKNQTQELVKKLKSKYKLVKHNKYASGESFKFINKKKDPKSQFTISYAKTIAGPYISYDGVFGE